MAVPIGVTLTGDGLTELQMLSAQHVAFLLTDACPLQCAHCAVSTVAPGKSSCTMPLSKAQLYAAQLLDLKERGVRLISFTGGEPLLAAGQLRLLSVAAGLAGLEATVTTSCHWANTESAARRVIEEFSSVTRWHLSTDVFHEEWVSPDNVVRAARAALAEGRSTLIRMTAPPTLDEDHERLYQYLRARLPADAEFLIQPAARVGRCNVSGGQAANHSAQASLCVPSGLVVRQDGSVSPCCAALIDRREGHPFQYGRADEVGLVEIHRAWCRDPLLRLMRGVGFGPILSWIGRECLDHPTLAATHRHPCDLCLDLWQDPLTGPRLRDWAELPKNREKISALTSEVFGDAFI